MSPEGVFGPSRFLYAKSGDVFDVREKEKRVLTRYNLERAQKTYSSECLLNDGTILQIIPVTGNRNQSPHTLQMIKFSNIQQILLLRTLDI
jgi:hypothetical protein